MFVFFPRCYPYKQSAIHYTVTVKKTTFCYRYIITSCHFLAECEYSLSWMKSFKGYYCITLLSITKHGVVNKETNPLIDESYQENYKNSGVTIY